MGIEKLNNKTGFYEIIEFNFVTYNDNWFY